MPHLVVVAPPRRPGPLSHQVRCALLEDRGAQRRLHLVAEADDARAPPTAAAAVRGRRGIAPATSPAASLASTASQSPASVASRRYGRDARSSSPEQVLEPVHLGPQRRVGVAVLVEQDGQLVAGEPRGEQASSSRISECRGLSRRVRPGPRPSWTVSSASERPSDCRSTCRPWAGSAGGDAAEQAAGELGLRHPRGRADQGDRLRDRRPRSPPVMSRTPRDLRRRRVVDRGRRAAPAAHRLR